MNNFDPANPSDRSAVKLYLKNRHGSPFIGTTKDKILYESLEKIDDAEEVIRGLVDGNCNAPGGKLFSLHKAKQQAREWLDGE